MADGLTHSWTKSQTGTKGSADEQWHENYPFSEINTSVANKKIPAYSRITACTVTATGKKDPKGNLNAGTMKLRVAGENLAKFADGELNYSGTHTLTYNILGGNYTNLVYVANETTDAGYIKSPSGTKFSIYLYFLYFFNQNFTSTITINWTYNEPRAIVNVSKSGEGTVKILNNSNTEVSNGSVHHYNNNYTITANDNIIGWRFIKWSDGSTDKSRTFTVNNSLITSYETSKNYQAIFEENKYTISFNGNGNTGGAMSSMSNIGYDDSINLTANAFTKTGYSFNGWNTKADGTGISYENQKNVSKLTSENGATITLYAQWILKTPTITFDPRGGTVSPTSQSVTWGLEYGKLPTPEKTGHLFQGWYYIGNRITSTTIVSEEDDHELIAVWAPLAFTLTFNPNGGTVSPTYFNVIYGYKYGELPTPIRTGYIFNGWFTAATGGSKITSETIMVDEDQTVYAQWTAHSYTIIFNGNGASNENAMTEQAFTYGVSKKLTKNVFTKPYHTFTGWKDSSGNFYVDEAEILNLTAENNVKIELFAQWQRNFTGEILIGNTLYKVIKILIDTDKTVTKAYIDKKLTFLE